MGNFFEDLLGIGKKKNSLEAQLGLGGLLGNVIGSVAPQAAPFLNVAQTVGKVLTGNVPSVGTPGINPNQNIPVKSVTPGLVKTVGTAGTVNSTVPTTAGGKCFVGETLITVGGVQKCQTKSGAIFPLVGTPAKVSSGSPPVSIAPVTSGVGVAQTSPVLKAPVLKLAPTPVFNPVPIPVAGPPKGGFGAELLLPPPFGSFGQGGLQPVPSGGSMGNGPFKQLTTTAMQTSINAPTSEVLAFAQDMNGQMQRVFQTFGVGPLGGLAKIWVFQNGTPAPKDSRGKVMIFEPRPNAAGGVKFVMRRKRKRMNVMNEKAFRRSVKRIKGAEKLCRTMFTFGQKTGAKGKRRKRK